MPKKQLAETPSRADMEYAEHDDPDDRHDASDDDDERSTDQTSLSSSEFPLDVDLRTAQTSLRNFYRMSVLLSAVPASAIACLSLATARFGSVGAWQSGLLYLTYTLSALMGATYIVKCVGSRNGMQYGMALYNIYIGCFWVAASGWLPTDESIRPVVLTGAAMGGIGAGIMWTSQGVYFSQAAEAYSLASGMDWCEANGMLAGSFAFVLLLEETTLDVLSTVLIRYFAVSWNVIFALYFVAAVAATMAMNLVLEYPAEEIDPTVDQGCYHSFTSIASKAMVAGQLLINDPKMKYMIGSTASFGFAGAFLNSFVSGEVVPVALHDSQNSFVGVLVAIHGLVAAGCSLLFGKLTHYTGKGPILILGSLAFASVALPFLIQPDLTRWNWKHIIALYAIQGVGRATFEGSLKAIFADYFAYEKEGAFANIILQNGLASSLAYILSFRLTCSAPTDKYCIEYRDGSFHDIFTFGTLVVGTSLLAIVGFWRASCFHNADQARRQHRRSSLMSYRAARRWSEQAFFAPRRSYQALEGVSTDNVEITRDVV